MTEVNHAPTRALMDGISRHLADWCLYRSYQVILQSTNLYLARGRILNNWVHDVGTDFLHYSLYVNGLV